MAIKDFEAEEAYILAHTDAPEPTLKALERLAHVRLARPRMISGTLQGRVLKMLVRLLKPQRVLELGTYTGYSALCLAEGLPEHGRVDTVECDDEMEDFIRHFLALSPYGERVTLHLGDAVELTHELMRAHSYQLVYMDANKREYIDYYEAVMQYLPIGGVIVADNTLWDGKLTQTPPPTDAQSQAIMAFNDRVQADERVENLILPLRDGLSVLYRVK